MALENCTKTESFAQSLFCARRRTHRRYGMPASASNVISKYLDGVAEAVVSFAASAFGYQTAEPPAAVESLVFAHEPTSVADVPGLREMSPAPSVCASAEARPAKNRSATAAGPRHEGIFI